MTRIIVIGNSHVAALRTAWTEIEAEHPGIEIDFFAAPGRHFLKFRLSKDLRFGLTPAQAARPDAVFEISGRASIDLSAADCVVWAGVPSPLYVVAELLRNFDIDGLREVGARQILSRAAFDAFCAGMAEELLPPPEWRDWRKRRLMLLLAPMRSADCLDNPAPRFRRFHFLGKDGAGGREAFGAFFDRVAQRLGAVGIELVPQPMETMLPSGLTDIRFTRGASRFRDLSEGAKDVTHMNAEYGKLMLTEILTRLAPAERSPAQAVAL